MRENELRIGNLVYHNDKIIEIKSLHPQDDDVNDEIPFHSIFGIPLTEEWLLKFGFEKKGKRISKGWFYLWDENGIIFFALAEMHDEIGQYLNIKHVHQLQNIYFALTNQEL